VCIVELASCCSSYTYPGREGVSGDMLIAPGSDGTLAADTVSLRFAAEPRDSTARCEGTRPASRDTTKQNTQASLHSVRALGWSTHTHTHTPAVDISLEYASELAGSIEMSLLSIALQWTHKQTQVTSMLQTQMLRVRPIPVLSVRRCQAVHFTNFNHCMRTHT
jgi:hypothetical protein